MTVLVCALTLSALGFVDRALNACGLGYLDKTNASYLDEAFDRSLAGFLLLSTIKSGLAIVEGSEVGIGFSIELGDIVQPMYDYIDIAWRAALAGGSVIVGMQLALKGLRLVDQWALTGLGLILMGYFLTLWYLPHQSWLRDGCKGAARFGATLCVALYLLLPLSVTGAAALSQQVTRPLVEASHEELKAIGSALSPEHISGHFMSDTNGQTISALDLKSALANAGRGVLALVTFLKTESERIATLTIKLVAAYVFDCILFPLFFALILFTMLKSGVRYIFDFNRLR
jgi:hypothetical protein